MIDAVMRALGIALAMGWEILWPDTGFSRAHEPAQCMDTGEKESASRPLRTTVPTVFKALSLPENIRVPSRAKAVVTDTAYLSIHNMWIIAQGHESIFSPGVASGDPPPRVGMTGLHGEQSFAGS